MGHFACAQCSPCPGHVYRRALTLSIIDEQFLNSISLDLCFWGSKNMYFGSIRKRGGPFPFACILQSYCQSCSIHWISLS